MPFAVFARAGEESFLYHSKMTVLILRMCIASVSNYGVR